MSDFRDIGMDPRVPKSTRALEDALNDVTDPSLVREKMLQVLHQQGQVIYTRDDEFNPRLVAQQPSEPPQVAMPAGPDTCIRVVYPGGNTRCEIYGTSEEALDAQETKLRAMFGQR